MRLALSQIRVDGGTQPRAELDEKTVAEYAEAMRDGASFPKVVVFHDGKVHWLADGFHRYGAAKREGLDLEAEIRQGTQRDAVLYSVGANSDHGLRRTKEDKRRAVLRLLEDEEWGQWSNRGIAKRCAVDEGMVRNLRLVSADNPQIERKVNRNGTTYAQNTANIGRATAPRSVVDEMALEREAGRPQCEEPAESTSTDKAIGDIRNYVDVVLDEVDTDMGRHFVANSIIKYLRDKSIAYNQSA
jgi:hypothetical protein